VRLVSTLRVGEPSCAGGGPDYVRGEHSFGVGENCFAVEKAGRLQTLYLASPGLCWAYAQAMRDFVTAMRNYVAALKTRTGN